MLAFNNKTEKGFTMIELVMVIVIIGILAAAAIPRFANLSTQAQLASNHGTGGALRAAVGVAHAAWIAAGSSSSASTVTLDTQAISLNSSGWPDAGMGTTATAAGCNTLFSTVLLSPPSSSITAANLSDSPAYAVSAASNTCTYTMYSGSTAVSPARTITYNLSTGAVGAT